MTTERLAQDETSTWSVPMYEHHLSLRVNRYSHVEAGEGWRSSCALLVGRGGVQAPQEMFLRITTIDLLIEALEKAKAQMKMWNAQGRDA